MSSAMPRADARRTRRSIVVVAIGMCGALLVLALAWIGFSGESAVMAIAESASESGVLERVEGVAVPSVDADVAGPEDVVPGSREALTRSDVPVRVRVEHADGEPAAGARLVLHDAYRALSEARADAEGRALLRLPRDARDDVCVAVVGVLWGVHDEPLALPDDVGASDGIGTRGALAELVIRLPHAGLIAGVLTVEGKLPETDVELALWGRDWKPATLPEALWRELAGANSDKDGRWQVARVRAGDGSFAFRGIPHDARGFVHPPPSHEFVAEPKVRGSYPIAGPAEGLVLDLVPFHWIRGRVVDGGGAPIAGATVRVGRLGPTRVDYEDRTETAGDGRFVLRRRRPVLSEGATAYVEARSPDGRLTVARMVAGDWYEHDFGDWVLDAAGSRVVRVLDARGAPIRGAAVHWNASPEPVFTGRDGRAEVSVTELRMTVVTSELGRRSVGLFEYPGQTIRAARFTMHLEGGSSISVLDEVTLATQTYVRASGYCTGLVFGTEFEADDSAEKVVVLHRASELIVSARGADGSHWSEAGGVVEVSSRDDLVGDGWMHDDSEGSLAPHRGNRFRIPLGLDGTRTIHGVRAGVTVSVRLLDATGFTVAGPVGIETSARSRVELVVDGSPRWLRGSVVSLEGHPVRGASVAVGVPGLDGVETRAQLVTDSRGRFAVETFAPAVRVVVTGLFPERDLDSVDPSEPLEVRVEPIPEGLLCTDV